MIRLTEDEAWDVLAKAHTGILTTLRRDGTPVSLRVWYATATILRFVPEGRILTWDNSRLLIKGSSR